MLRRISTVKNRKPVPFPVMATTIRTSMMATLSSIQKSMPALKAEPVMPTSPVCTMAKAKDAYGITAEQIATLTPLNSLHNFIPVTLGNMIGGMVFVGLPLYLIYKKKWD